MVESAAALARELCTPLARPRWLSLLGSSGAGKTMLARMVLNEAQIFADQYPYLENGAYIRRVRFVTWPKVVARLREGDFDVLNDIQRAWFLVIDDVGAEHDARNSFIPSKLYDLCTARLGRWTLITSNFNLAQIADRIDPRVASRMRRDGGKTVEVNVKDYNLRSAPVAA